MQEENNNIIPLSHCETLKKEIEKLRMELSMLILERDELQYLQCKNIETAYMLALGNLEYKIFEMQCTLLRLKRKAQLIQTKVNRQEKIILSHIESTLNVEFAEYQQKIDEQLDKINQAIQHNQGELLSHEETREFRKLYRRIVKILHPDLNPELSAAQLRLFENTVTAYKNGDLNMLRIINEAVAEPILLDMEQNTMVQLLKQKEHLVKMLQTVRDSMDEIKSQYPYTVKELVQDPEKIAQRKEALEDIVCQYEEGIAVYTEKIKELLR